MSNVNFTHASNDGFVTRPGLAIGNPLSFVRVAMQRIRDRRELNYLLSLSDYQLKDIGIARGDIQREAIKPFWRA